MRKANILLILLGLGVVVYLALRFTPVVSGNAIAVHVVSPEKYYSPSKPVVINIKDRYPLREIKVEVYSMGVPVLLYKKVFLTKSVKEFKVSFKTSKKLPNGKAQFVVRVSDYSKRNFFGGFSRRVVRSVIIDSTPPQVYLLSGIDNMAAGGSGIAIFYVKDRIPLKKVFIKVTYGAGRRAVFRAYNASGMFDGKPVYIGFFTYPYSRIHNWNTSVVVEDEANNVITVHVPVYYYVPRVRRPHVYLRKNFMNRKIKEIFSHEGIHFKGDVLEGFLYLMHKVFPDNLKEIRKICSHSKNEFLWRRYPFTQLFHSKVETGFYVMRRWIYRHEVIFKTPFYHPGYDLASVAHAMVNASNAGKVVYEGYIGVFGKTLIIDHGFGVFSIYSHLSSYLVPVGARVARNQYVAISDTTGLAFGDHVDFGILLSGWFVNPLDWWDPRWMRYNVMDKIRHAKVRLALLDNY